MGAFTKKRVLRALNILEKKLVGDPEEKNKRADLRYLLERTWERLVVDSMQLRIDCIHDGQRNALRMVPDFLAGEYTITKEKRGPNGLPTFTLSGAGYTALIDMRNEHK